MTQTFDGMPARPAHLAAYGNRGMVLDQARTSILDLPAELRLQIYRYAFAPRIPQTPVIKIYRREVQSARLPSSREDPTRQYVEVGLSMQVQFEHQPECAITPSLLRACKLIYTEALPVLYDVWSFYPSDDVTGKEMFYWGRMPFAPNVRRLRIPLDYCSQRNAFENMPTNWGISCRQIEALFPDVKSVELLVNMPVYMMVTRSGELSPWIVEPIRKIGRGIDLILFHERGSIHFDVSLSALVKGTTRTWKTRLSNRLKKEDKT